MGYSDSAKIERLMVAAGLPADAGPLDAALPEPPPIDNRIADVADTLRISITGQQTPIGAGMQNRTIKVRTDALEARVALLEQLSQQLLTGAAATDAAVQSTVARLELVRAAGAAMELRVAADEVRLAAVEAKATLTASATEANRLDIAKNTAADLLRDARLSQDEAAITAAQTAANQARDAAVAAQKKADEDAAGLTALQQQLTQAQAAVAANTASLATLAADVAKKLPADAVQRFTIPTPAVTLAVGTPTVVPVTLPKAFADANYLCFFTAAVGQALLNVKLSDTNKAPATFGLTMQQTGLASLAVAASQAEALIIHL